MGPWKHIYNIKELQLPVFIKDESQSFVSELHINSKLYLLKTLTSSACEEMLREVHTHLVIQILENLFNFLIIGKTLSKKTGIYIYHQSMKTWMKYEIKNDFGFWWPIFKKKLLLRQKNHWLLSLFENNIVQNKKAHISRKAPGSVFPPHPGDNVSSLS